MIKALIVGRATVQAALLASTAPPTCASHDKPSPNERVMLKAIGIGVAGHCFPLRAYCFLFNFLRCLRSFLRRIFSPATNHDCKNHQIDHMQAEMLEFQPLYIVLSLQHSKSFTCDADHSHGASPTWWAKMAEGTLEATLASILPVRSPTKTGYGMVWLSLLSLLSLHCSL